MTIELKNRIQKIETYLDSLYPNPRCELIYHKDYELLIAVVLSAQTTDKRVNSVTPILFGRYPTLKDLKQAEIQDIAEIIKSIGTFHKKALFVKEIARFLDEECHGIVPNDRTILEQLPGVGRKTANVVLSNIYDVPAIAVDTHVERVSKRLYLASLNDSVYDVEQKLMKKFDRTHWSKRHHQLVLFGRYYCKAVHPLCDDCPLQVLCRYYKSKDK